MIEVIWYGRGGQGAFTAARLLGLAAGLYMNREALAFPTFGPERRGAPVMSFTKLDVKKIIDRSEIEQADYIVILDETLFTENLLAMLKKHGKLLINTKDETKYAGYGERILVIDASGLSEKILGRVTANTAMLGALSGLTGMIDIDALGKALQTEFSAGIAAKNLELIKNTADYTIAETARAKTNPDLEVVND